MYLYLTLFSLVFLLLLLSEQCIYAYEHTSLFSQNAQCPTGYWGESCSNKCDSKCLVYIKNCDSSTGYCEECSPGYNCLTIDSSECVPCLSECYTCSLGKCLTCNNRIAFGSSCNQTCDTCYVPDPSESEHNICLNDGICLYACKEGYYGDKCLNKCGPNCYFCTRDEGKCELCKEGYYGEDCLACPEHCAECESATLCTKCINDSYYGDTCNNVCPSGCYEGKCYMNGTCFVCIENFTGDKCDECVEGKYSLNCNENCSKGCNVTYENCDRSSGTCKKCYKGYFGAKCEYECEEGCLNCDKETASCIECKDGYYLEGTKCINCSSKGKCLEHLCTSEGCIECESGFFGNWCDSKCPLHCVNQTCDQHTGKCECEEGFVGEQCDKCRFNFTGELCNETCSEGCDISEEDGVNCNRNGSCNCILSFYGNKCDMHCNANCDLSKGNCDQYNGTCVECVKGFYGDTCEKKCTDDNCNVCDRENGNCTECKDKFYLSNNNCVECPSTCLDKGCSSAGCFQCASVYTYDAFCNKTCPLHCKHPIETEFKCDRTGKCINGCEDNFKGYTCSECIDFKWGENCSENCSEGCIGNCDKASGQCSNCHKGWWSTKCDEPCPMYCDTSTTNCFKSDGECPQCRSGYYGKACDKCPETCLFVCSYANGCSGCKEGKYGKWCNLTCPGNCQKGVCIQHSGSCEQCISGFYGDDCSNSCEGCNGECYRMSGKCSNRNCKEGFYGVEFCKLQCGNQCKDGICDLYTGECKKCENSNKWGINCENDCSLECKEDSRKDCCYAKQSKTIYKNISLSLFTEEINNDNNNNNINSINSNSFGNTVKYSKLRFYIGSENILVDVYVDFDSNAPLVIFDKSKPPTNEPNSPKINTNPLYSSSNSTSFSLSQEHQQNFFEGTYLDMEVKGEYCTENITLTDNSLNNYTVKSNFIRITSYKVESLLIQSEINAIVGLGFLNTFCDDLVLSRVIQKNIVVFRLPSVRILFGDYNSFIKSNFTKLSTIIPLEQQYGDNTIKAQMYGFAYSTTKKYILETVVKFSYTQPISSISFNNSMIPFFKNLYFGAFSQCRLEERPTEKEFVCTSTGFDYGKVQDFGLIINDYFYLLPKDILFTKDIHDRIYFKIKIKDKNEIILGTDFLRNYEIVHNKGNGTLGLLNETTRLVNRKELVPIDIKDDENENDSLSPGSLAIIIIYSGVAMIVLVHIGKICISRKKTDIVEETFVEKKELLNEPVF